MNKFISETGFSEEMERIDKQWDKWWYPIYWWGRYGIWEWISYRPLKIKSFFQRGYRGWADEDTWGFDGYLAKVISEGCKHLKEHKHGIPCEYVSFKKDKSYEYDEKEGEEGERRWNEVLDKVIFAFDLIRQIQYDGDKEFYLGRLSEEDRKRFNCITKEENDKIEEGKKLFIDNFTNFWD